MVEQRSHTASIAYAFAIGQTVEALPYGGRWRKALITALAPQKCRPGYYIEWQPRPVVDPVTRLAPSTGGWMPENCIRHRTDDSNNGVTP